MKSSEAMLKFTLYCRLQYGSWLLLLFLSLSLVLTGHSVAANDTAVECESRQDSPRRPFDELYDVLMVRHGRNGVAYGANEIAPMIFKFSEFPFDDATYPRLKAALDAITLEEIKSQTVEQRAIQQRQLWAIYDATTPSRFVRRRTHEKRRSAVQVRLADLILQLALKQAEIEALPDTLLKTVQAEAYPSRFDVNQPTLAFLPTGLAELSEESPAWICFGRSSTPVTFHAERDRWRSAFFQFIRLPQARDETLNYLDGWERQDEFPVGTQVALIEKAFLISDKGEIVLSPMTVGVQLRAYRDVEQSFRESKTVTQCVAEFISRPMEYSRGNALLTAIRPSDHRFKALLMGGDKQDVFETVDDPQASRQTRLRQCMNCHSGAGTNSLGDVIAPRGQLRTLQRRSQMEIAAATADAKQRDASWKSLKSVWDKANRITHPNE